MKPVRKYWIDAIFIIVIVGILVIGLFTRNKDRTGYGKPAPSEKQQTREAVISPERPGPEEAPDKTASVHHDETESVQRSDRENQETIRAEHENTAEYVSYANPVKPDRPAGAGAAINMTEEERMEKFFTYDEKYYSTIDYNRLQQTRPLKPGEKLPPIKVVRGGYQYALRGQEASKPIEVRVPANMPCTFHAQDLGHFVENRKNIITVKADSEGIARVHYVCSETGGGSLIIAHSPEASGWARIQVVGLKEKDYDRLLKEKPELFD